ncbi:hypothetical protein L4X63_18755 [Geomonas sp. Red32]|uniref:hypothetical protein n=1 Tax=Geomonas sp. Red32 TaxID=2912856 RepID=UPI00202D084A|nr:hypothetical protein [Geomonas sp. Red32]MCM0083630.1 hypothetical protein [Geomonas sp. Red32]
MSKKLWPVLISASLATAVLAGCSGPGRNYKVGVVGFQQCRPDLVLKEIGYNDIKTRNDANLCSKKGMPVIFAAELASRLQQLLKKEVVIVPLDVPYNYNIRSQIDIARREKLDYVVGGKIDGYVDPNAVDRARAAGILPYTATLSPTPSAIPDNAPTVLYVDLKVARTSDGKILSELQYSEEGDKGGDYYTAEVAKKIAGTIGSYE